MPTADHHKENVKLHLIKYEGQRSRICVVHITLRQEEFSRAYVRAIAAVAGFATSVPTPDNQSVDLNLRKNSSDDEQEDIIVDPQLDLQLKCTGQDIVHNDALHLQLKLKNYDDLRRERLEVRRLLVVHLIPPDIEKWLSHAEEDYMALRHCSYWVSLEGRPALPPGQEKVTVHIPRANRFTAESLSEIMDRIKRREPL